MMNLEPFSLSLSTPLETAAGTIDARSGFVVRTKLDGTEGVGEATPLPGWTESLDACEAALRAVDDPRTTLEGSRLAEAPAARHGLSLAVLDAEARRAGRPLYRHLGGTERRLGVPVNATVGDGPPAEVASTVAAAAADGYPAIKLKVGAREPEADLDRVEAVQAHCSDVELRVDANGAWSLDAASRLIPALAELDVDVVEQPLPVEDLSGHAELRGHGVEIALDEGLHEHGLQAILAADAADLLVCKPMALGGIDRARRIVEAARGAGVDAVVTTTIDAAIARAAAVHLAASVPDVRPCGLATAGMLESDLRDGIAPISDGSASVPQGKGNIPRR